MKILAIEKDLKAVDWEKESQTLNEEALLVFELYQEEIIREIYFSDSKNAILILECEDKSEANSILNDFPLVKKGLIEFEILELQAYTGFSRLMNMK